MAACDEPWHMSTEEVQMIRVMAHEKGVLSSKIVLRMAHCIDKLNAELAAATQAGGDGGA